MSPLLKRGRHDLQNLHRPRFAVERHARCSDATAWQVFNLNRRTINRACPRRLSPSFRRENILDQDAFVSALREVLDPISGAEERLSLALPERAGRILLTQVETALVNKAEGVEILKWQLRDTLPADGALQLDYQILDRDESGRQHVLVSCITEEVLKQYEDCFNLAGYGPKRSTLEVFARLIFIETDSNPMTILSLSFLKNNRWSCRFIKVVFRYTIAPVR